MPLTAAGKPPIGHPVGQADKAQQQEEGEVDIDVDAEEPTEF